MLPVGIEDGGMNLLRSICCLLGGRCAAEEPKPTKETMGGKRTVAEGDLAEAELEKTGKEQMGHTGADPQQNRSAVTNY
jgi:hypothetical protein